MPEPDSIHSIAAIVQVAVAPVFLLAGIAGFLSVMSGRLGRVIDRLREVERRLPALEDLEKIDISQQELTILRRRGRIINRAIGLCTSSALLVCLLVVVLFMSDYLQLALTEYIILLFAAAMLLLILALISFLQEIRLATKNMNIAKEY